MATLFIKTTKLEQDYLRYRHISFLGWLMILSSFLLLISTHGISSILFIIGTPMVLLTIKKRNILKAGVMGEKESLKVFKKLPANYTVINDFEIKSNGYRGQMDYVIVGPSGVFIVEIKNHNGRIMGNSIDHDWIQEKLGRGGTLYTSQMSNPMKQVGGQVYQFANYLKQHGIHTWINGVVFFSNENVTLNLKDNNGKIPIFSLNLNGTKQLIDYITQFNNQVDQNTQQKILKLIR